MAHATEVLADERTDERATSQTLEVDGRERRFNLYAPPGVSQAPLVITLHGHGQSAREVEALSGWNAIAAEHGAIVVYPFSRGTNWRIFGPSSPDVDFLLALIDRLAADGLVDPARVFVNGYSGGAQMSWRFACEVPTRVAAAGFVAGAAPDGCGLGRKPPVIMFHGEADLSLPYKNARGTLAIPALGRAWAARAGCTPRETVESLTGAEQRAERVSVHRWWCDDEAPVELYSFKRGGHDWPGRSRRGGSRSVDATATMWAFFQDHVRSTHEPATGPASPNKGIPSA
ncbi:MAG: alpha/beta hydrolase family esterase [Silanimonas sp.]